MAAAARDASVALMRILRNAGACVVGVVFVVFLQIVGVCVCVSFLFSVSSRPTQNNLTNTDAWLDPGLTPEDWALLKAEVAAAAAAQGGDDYDSSDGEGEEDAMDVEGPQQRRRRAGGGGVLNPVERHIFAPQALGRREEELARLKATCLPELAALLHQVCVRVLSCR
jgi:hypothetical protein